MGNINMSNTVDQRNSADFIKKSLKIKTIITMSTVITLLAIWFLTTKMQWISEIFVPSPEQVFHAFKETFFNGYKGNTLLQHLYFSMYRLMISFLLAGSIGVPLGLACGYRLNLSAVFEPLVHFYRILPPLAYYSLLVMWMGIENGSKIALLFLAAFPPIFISCAAGVKNVKSSYILGAYTLGAGNRQVFWNVIFPSCLPEIFTGMRTSIGVAYSTLVAAEMTAATSGIGWMVLDAGRFLRSDIIFTGILVMGITGVILDALLKLLEAKIVPWKGKE